MFKALILSNGEFRLDGGNFVGRNGTDSFGSAYVGGEAFAELGCEPVIIGGARVIPESDYGKGRGAGQQMGPAPLVSTNRGQCNEDERGRRPRLPARTRRVKARPGSPHGAE